MSDKLTKKLIKQYVETAAELALAVKRNLTKEGKIDSQTVLKLNAFTMADNELREALPGFIDHINDVDTDKH